MSDRRRIAALQFAISEAAQRIATDPAALARAKAVTEESPLRDRLAASLLGTYMPMTGNEAHEIDVALSAFVSDALACNEIAE